MPAMSVAAAIPAAGPYAASSQLPTLIGDVGLATRSMLANRSGRPRSATRQPAPAVTAAAATTRAGRTRATAPAASAAAASVDDAPASPPRNRYEGIQCRHVGFL